MADNLLDKASILLTPTAYDNGSMLSVKPDNGDGDFDFERNSAATRVNAQGLVENVQIISSELVSNGDFSQIGTEEVLNGDFSQEGSELVTNGDFDTDSDWTKNDWNISGGTLNGSASTGIVFQSNLGIVVGKTYKVVLEISNYTSGSIRFKVGGASYQNIASEDGVQEFYFVAATTANNILFSVQSAYTGSIDNVSVKEVGQNWQLGSGWSIGDGEGIATSSANGQRLGQYILIPTVGKTYKVTYEIKSITEGAFRVWLGGVLTSTDNTAVGVYTFSITATDTSSFYIRTVLTTSGSISNVSVKEITDDTNLPRIDYTDGCGVWLLEPQSTNLATESENISGWSFPTNVTTTQNYGTSPDGSANSTRLQFTANGFMNDALTLTSGTEYTLSIYAKRNDTGTQSFGFYVDGIPTIVGGITLTDEWQRFTYTYTASSNSSIGLAGDSGADVSVFGFQAEAQSYATSYIPTSGATNTRLQDIANNSGNSSLINSTEGVLYAEIATFDDGSNRIIRISDGGGNTNAIEFRYAPDGNLHYDIWVGGVSQFSGYYTSFVQTDENKIAIKYKENDFALWINGTEIATDTSGVTFSANTLNDLSFSRGSQFNFYGKAKAVAVYKEALTDAELQSLTTQ